MPLDTCAIITTRANELVAPLHDRMPIILRQSDYETLAIPAHRARAATARSARALRSRRNVCPPRQPTGEQSQNSSHEFMPKSACYWFSSRLANLRRVERRLADKGQLSHMCEVRRLNSHYFVASMAMDKSLSPGVTSAVSPEVS